MSDMTESEIRAKLLDYQRRIDQAPTNTEKNEIAKESMEFYTSVGKAVPVESLEGAIQFARTMVDRVLMSILKTAEDMNATHVPVSFLASVRDEIGQFIADSVWQSADILGVPLEYGVPDDLAELEGL
jgi:hypothetical protein